MIDSPETSDPEGGHSRQSPEKPLVPIPITSDMLAGDRLRPPAELRLDFERGMCRFPCLTVLIIIACGLVFIAELAGGSLSSKDALIRAGALSRDHLLRGEWWRAFSAMFLHGSVEHLLGNCVVLYIVGMACEHAFGVPGLLGIYAVSGVAGALLSVLLNPGPSVGASGAIFGVAAAVIVFLYRHQRHFFLRDKRIGVVLLVWAGFQIATGFMYPLIDNFNHIGGFLGGAMAALAFRPRLFPAVRGGCRTVS